MSSVKKCIVVKRTGNYVYWEQGRDVWYHDLIKDVPNYCEPEEMSAEDPLFILYTSGSTGKPKGVLHTTGGYMVYASMTHQYIFNYNLKIFIGALLILAGLQDIVILFMDLYLMGQLLLCLKECPTILTALGGGKSWINSK